MYKYLLAWRYLRTRYIALASIISVTLGVATLIVVNSVMAGFSQEMNKRLHGILSDIVVECHNLRGLENPEWHMQEIAKVVGDDLEGITPTVHVPAMVNFRYRGRWITQQINLIGIDEKTYAKVSDFSGFLLHPENREQLSFLLRENGYGTEKEAFPVSGWFYRREVLAPQAAYRQSLETAPPLAAASALSTASNTAGGEATPNGDARFGPVAPPSVILSDGGGVNLDAARSLNNHPVGLNDKVPASGLPADPFAGSLAQTQQDTFDPATEQFTGVILGIAICSRKFRNTEGEVEDFYLCRPGDDVQITFPNVGTPPQPRSDSFTVVDLYESKMSEYDSSFAFVPLRELQRLRGMSDEASGIASVTSLQIKLKQGADLEAIRDKLQARFPLQVYQYRIQTWKDMQGPLLAAVRLETTILNILLFLIIAVAGFGILATFFMIVVEKTRDIGILKSLGASNRGVMAIFLSYGLCLGTVGSGAGMLLGLLFVRHINRIASWIELATGQPVFDPTVYYFQEIPTIVQPFTLVWVVIGAVGIAVMASILPAHQASRLHPVRALRFE